MEYTTPQDKSNGYEDVAETFMRVRDRHIGLATVQKWGKTLPPGASILDLGCGHGVPIAEALINDGFAVYGIDASEKMIGAFRTRFPGVLAENSAAEESKFFSRTFDGVVAWGLMFLLAADVQAALIGKVARALKPTGKFLFTAPQEARNWLDVLTGLASTSLGADSYRRILRAEGLILTGEEFDEGDNHYYLASKEA